MKESNYDLRYKKFLYRINAVSKLVPRDKYLYPIMDGVPFKDLETAIMMAEISYKRIKNDNRKT